MQSNHLLTVAILFVVKDTAVTMWQRLLDVVDLEIVEQIEDLAQKIPGVDSVHAARIRWLGHKLHAELHITVDKDLRPPESRRIVEEARHMLLHTRLRLAIINVHADPR